MVADHKRDFGLELSHAPAGQQVVHAVGQLRDEDGDAGDEVGEVEAPGQAEAPGDRLERLANLRAGDSEVLQLPLDALEEDALL